ncbi:MAG: response regulator [Pirellulales bacterium]|jgi:CheY-like chemotaxis protein
MRIIVVDDHCDSAEVLAILLRGKERQVKVCHSGTECLSLVDSFEPQFVLLDLCMPGMDGWETARCLHEHHPTVRLIAITNLDTENDRRRSEEAGFEQHMTKPVRLDKLLPIMNQLAAG